MQLPVQAPPRPRDFMQLIVGREWVPAYEEDADGEVKVRQVTTRGGRRVRNPCLLQLTTFAVQPGTRPRGGAAPA